MARSSTAQRTVISTRSIHERQLLWKQSPFPNGNAMVFNGVATDGKYVAVPYGLSTDTTHGGVAVFDLQGNLKWSL